MTAEFVGYVAFVSLLFAVAALGAEQVCALYRWPRRFMWALAIIASLGFPLSMALSTKPDTSSANADASATALPQFLRVASAFHATAPVNHETGTGGPGASVLASKVVTQRPIQFPLSLNRALLAIWLTLSVALVWYYGLAWLRLRRTLALTQRHVIDGIAIRVTDQTGPGVCGLLRPEILIPRWLLEAPTPTRSLAIEHELQHIFARDPALLVGAMAALVLTPWNPALWFMLRRLRFAIEADCDARVVKATGDAQAYSEALLSVCERRASLPAGSVALSSPRSWLERRVRIMLTETTRLNRLLAASGSVWALVLLAIALTLHAPGLAAPGELRKLRPDDTKLGTSRVRALTHARFPELFDSKFSGMAEVIMILNQDGSVVRAQMHKYRPAELPRADDQELEADNRELGLEQGDILYGDAVDIQRPDGDGTRGIGYIEYEILKWPHDPKRAESRVLAAVQAYFPELTMPGSPNSDVCSYRVALLMNDDGSVRRARKTDIACHGNSGGSQDEQLNDFRIPTKELGRTGNLGFMTPAQHSVTVNYAWPRHADDPPNVEDLGSGRVNAAIWQQHRPREDTRDDAAIIARYFPDIEAHGHDDLFRTIDGRRYRLEPWILFGRDGEVWQTGRRLARDSPHAMGPGLTQEVEARYPGIRTSSISPLVVHGVVINCMWISADSPVQRLADVGSRKDLLVNTDFSEDVPLANPIGLGPNAIVLSLAQAATFGAPTGIGLVQRFIELNRKVEMPLTARLIATQASPQEVNLELQIREDLVATADSKPGSEQWTRVALRRVSYGGSTAIDLLDLSHGSPLKLELVLRPQLLGSSADQP
jgi:beta-lactamase regulating signal transducer with metallopeptidase domain